MAYKYGLLKSGDFEEVRKSNDSLLGMNTLGVEVTQPALAARCGLGNLDPQHGNNPNINSSAIEGAMTCALPPAGATLVTMRPDRDSFGAMAVLRLRAEGRGSSINKNLVWAIARVDSIGVHQAFKKFPEIAQWKTELDAMQAVVTNFKNRWGEDVQSRINYVAQILSGECAKNGANDLQTLAKEFLDSISGKHFEVSEICWGCVLVVGDYRGARDFGSKYFFVTLAKDEAFVEPGVDGYKPHLRWSITRKHAEVKLDMPALRAAINAAEAEARGISLDQLAERKLTWGGPLNITSCPVGVISALSEETIIGLVKSACQNLGSR